MESPFDRHFGKTLYALCQLFSSRGTQDDIIHINIRFNVCQIANWLEKVLYIVLDNSRACFAISVVNLCPFENAHQALKLVEGTEKVNFSQSWDCRGIEKKQSLISIIIRHKLPGIAGIQGNPLGVSLDDHSLIDLLKIL